MLQLLEEHTKIFTAQPGQQVSPGFYLLARSSDSLSHSNTILVIYLFAHSPILGDKPKKIHPNAKPPTIETRKHHPVPIHPTRWPFQTSVKNTVQCLVQPSKIHDHLVAKSTKAMGKATHRIVGTMGRGQSFVGRRKKFFNR